MTKEKKLAAIGVVPVWKLRILRFRGRVVKRFERLAPYEEALLDAFQTEQFARWIKNPFLHIPGENGKKRLHQTIQNFNRRLDCPLIRLRGGNGGTLAGWEERRAT